jgi:hypothetical protein
MFLRSDKPSLTRPKNHRRSFTKFADGSCNCNWGAYSFSEIEVVEAQLLNTETVSRAKSIYRVKLEASIMMGLRQTSRRIAANARSNVHWLTERGDPLNLLVYAKLGSGLGFKQRVLCLNQRVGPTATAAVELAVNRGMASILKKKASTCSQTMQWMHTT